MFHLEKIIYMIKNIIFDIGNVLSDFRWHDFLIDKGFDEARIDRIAKATIESEIWYEYDRGEWTKEELMAAFVKNDPDLELDLHRAFDDIHDMVTPREYAIPWIQSLKNRGFGVYYLSNFSQTAKEECPESLSFIPYTDGGILSYKEKLVKPNPAIYRLLLRRYGLKAEECVFIDDTRKNVDAARKEGIHGIWFQTKEQVDRELSELLK